jgi:predicted DsbA family dithiol-disulfide isomerase
MTLSNFRLNRFLLGTFALVLAAAASAQTEPSSRPIAVIGEERIFEADLALIVIPQLPSIRKQEFDARKAALETMIGEKLIEREAKSRGITAQELVEKEVNARIAEPTDGEAEVFYLAQQNAQMPAMESILPQLKQRIRQLRLQAANAAFRRSLWRKHNAAILMRPAALEVARDPARIRGNPDSAVRIVEFTDFECPYCGRVQGVLEEVRKKYGDKVSIAVRDFPLRQIHARAQRAALASRCAGEQQKYWEYHDHLFAGNSSLEDAGLLKLATLLSLEESRFQKCLDSGKYEAAVEKDFQDGLRLGVNGTPSFFVNGIPVIGIQGIADFEKVIDAELAAIATGTH